MRKSEQIIQSYIDNRSQDYQEFIMTKNEISLNYKRYNDWIINEGEGIGITNDYDGLGLFFDVNDKYGAYAWIIDYLKQYKVSFQAYNAVLDDLRSGSKIGAFISVVKKIISGVFAAKNRKLLKN
jgi:hypothetical protein